MAGSRKRQDKHRSQVRKFFSSPLSVFSFLLIGKKPREQGVYTFLICFEFFFGWETNYILRVAKSLVVGIIWGFLGFSIKGALTSWLGRQLEKRKGQGPSSNHMGIFIKGSLKSWLARQGAKGTAKAQ
jgi:hypothetical protein